MGFKTAIFEEISFAALKEKSGLGPHHSDEPLIREVLFQTSRSPRKIQNTPNQEQFKVQNGRQVNNFSVTNINESILLHF